MLDTSIIAHERLEGEHGPRSDCPIPTLPGHRLDGHENVCLQQASIELGAQIDFACCVAQETFKRIFMFRLHDSPQLRALVEPDHCFDPL